MKRSIDESVDIAKKVIAGERIDAEALRELADELKRVRRFGLARRMLEKYHGDYCNRRIAAPDESLKRKLTQLLSLCTYKDPDLNPSDRLDCALTILKSLDNLDYRSENCTRDQETLGQAGAIFKRKWESSSQRSHLESSLVYYHRGYEQGIDKDYGYTAINAAFVLDLLASHETGQADVSDKVEQAREIRRKIITTLPGLAEQQGNEWLKAAWWYWVTIAEAHFGLGEYELARPFLQQAAAVPDVPEWEWETCARQLARLLQLLAKNGDSASIAAAKTVLQEFLGPRAAGLDALLKGKIGLALSGGGFRASLFHIGMLARLAELDLLRHVEYISCVSGGSIIGAHYYLEVRNLLQSKADSAITREDYIGIVKRVEQSFLVGVQSNIRVSVLSEWLANAKMMWSSDYSRTNRLGELYEENIFSRVGSPDSQPDRTQKFYLDELRVAPVGENDRFSPKDQNWRRAAKVPILILNATPLNTGHNWQFTTTWMGEPPAGASSEIDANYRLRRMYYEDAPPPHNKMRLGYAVAASSCVPGLFEPLPLAGVYPDKIVRLVDGGVHDNQGTSALLEQGCDVLLVSDASGQMDAQDEPSKGLLGVPLRANSILQARLRESQYYALDARRRSGLLRGLMFIHLKQGLESRPVDWINCQDPSDAPNNAPLLPYGVQREVQEKLAAVRTDLDSFSDVEAYALMASAYRMTEYVLKDVKSTLGFALPSAKRENWTFLGIEEEMRKPGSNTPLLRQLKVADQMFLKIWLLSKPLQIAGILLVVALLAFLAYSSYLWWSVPICVTWAVVATPVLLFALSAIVEHPTVIKILRFRKTAQEMLLGFTMAAVGSWLAKLHLKVFDKRFLAQGRLDALNNKTQETA